MTIRKARSSPETSVNPDEAVGVPEPRTWIPPAVETLPRLTELTLQSGGIPGGGGTGGGGSTVTP
jgi:hypothetical protein